MQRAKWIYVSVEREYGNMYMRVIGKSGSSGCGDAIYIDIFLQKCDTDVEYESNAAQLKIIDKNRSH